MKMPNGADVHLHTLLSWALLEVVSDELHTPATSPPWESAPVFLCLGG
jgi:hypothetical protein